MTRSSCTATTSHCGMALVHSRCLDGREGLAEEGEPKEEGSEVRGHCLWRVAWCGGKGDARLHQVAVNCEISRTIKKFQLAAFGCLLYAATAQVEPERRCG